MRIATLKHWITVVVAVWGFFTYEVWAGGPLQFNEQDGQAYRWPFDTAVFVVEGGKLGVFNNQQLKDAVERSFKTWQAVPTSSLFTENLVNLPDLIPPARLAPFQRDITVQDFANVTCPVLPGEPDNLQRPQFECDLLKTCVLEQNGVACPSPIVFDDPQDCSATSQENSIIKEFFGGDNTVLGFTVPFLTLGPAPQLPPDFRNTVVQAFVVVSGCFFSQASVDQLKESDPDGTKFLDSVLTHEFGHFVGLGHTSVNGDIALLNPSVKVVGVTATGKATVGKLDPLTSVDASAVETMYPINLADAQQSATQNTLEQDDKFSLSTIYPCTDASAKKQAGQCKPLSEGTGTIAGTVSILQADRTLQPAQGVLVIARRIDGDNTSSVDKSADVLEQAISQFTGNTFAPQRCTGQINFDKDGNGSTDLSLAGIFGPCTDVAQCQTEMSAEDGLIPRLSAIIDSAGQGTTARGEFVGQCGFTSANSSTSLPVGDAREGSFSLSGLSPGAYIVQALPAVCPNCGFSSPLRSSLGILDFVNTIFSDTPPLGVAASPIIQSDNNSALTFFPNPQTGEFYNGPAGGCNSTTPPCGAEVASSVDNPFAYTPIVVTAGQQVNNVNIFLNTASVDSFIDPGFNFCLLADTNGDGKVNQKDILAVSKARADFEKKKKLTNVTDFRADINRDNAVTFIDVDISTDLVSIPRPFDNPVAGIALSGSSSELKRGIATFDAICTAAKAGGCEIQAPAEDIQANGKPSNFTCNSAKEIGCKVTGCQ